MQKNFYRQKEKVKTVFFLLPYNKYMKSSIKNEKNSKIIFFIKNKFFKF